MNESGKREGRWADEKRDVKVNEGRTRVVRIRGVRYLCILCQRLGMHGSGVGVGANADTAEARDKLTDCRARNGDSGAG